MRQIEIKKKGLCIVTISNGNIKELRKTINSINKQIMQPDQHIVVCKNTNNYNLSIFKKKNRIFIINKDKSLYDAMNIGLAYNNFSHVWFLNSEDKLYNNLSILNLKKYLLLQKTLIAKTILQNSYDLFFPLKKKYLSKNYLPHSSFVAFLDRSNQKVKFSLDHEVEADGIWMQRIIQRKKIFLNVYLTIHKLGGVSTKPGIDKILKYKSFKEILKQILKFLCSLFINEKLYFRLIYVNKYLRISKLS